MISIFLVSNSPNLKFNFNRPRARGLNPIRAVVRPSIQPVIGSGILTVSPSNWDEATNYLPEGSTVIASSLTINGSPAEVGDSLVEGDVALLSVTIQATIDEEVVTRTFTSQITVSATPVLGNSLWNGSSTTWGGVPTTWGEAA